MSKFFLTTPIYYVNDKPHVGHMYTTVVADALARFHRLSGDEVFLSVGTDENSQKNIQAMEKAGEQDFAAYLERMSGVWKTTWKESGISFDDFVRTTEERHLKGVRRFWDAVLASGDIYPGEYEGWYCVGCEGFKVETDLTNGVCPLHPNKPLQHVKEKNYFFRLTKYRDQLLALYDESSTFVMPESRRNEIRNYVADHLSDISISREAPSAPAGIPVPGDDSQRMYVWFDALLNYMTVVGYGTDEVMFKKWWPTDLHLVGKDIIKFHCALWPAMLMSAAKNDPLLQAANGQPLLPKQVYAHGFFTINGQKISKSLGNAVDPRELADVYGMDALRYFLLREVSFGEDGDFSFDRLSERYTNDLANTLGNLLNRVIAMSRKYFDGKVPEVDREAAGRIEFGLLTVYGANEQGERICRFRKEEFLELARLVGSEYARCRCDRALKMIWFGEASVEEANRKIQETQPFKLIKTDEKKTAEVLYALLEACRWYAWMIAPMMPETAKKIWTQLGLDAEQELQKGWSHALIWGQLPCGQTLPEPQILFPAIVAKEEAM